MRIGDLNNTGPRFNFKARIIVIGVVLTACFGVVIGKAFIIMVHDGAEYRDKARRQHTREVTLAPKRGAIVDKNGRILAESILVDSLYAHPNQIPDAAGAAQILAPILGEKEKRLIEILAQDKNFVWLKRPMTPAEAAEIKRSDIKGVVPITEYARYYPEGALAAHVLGFTGIDGAGLEGVENRYDKQLKGSETILYVERDGLRRSIYTNPESLDMTVGGNKLVLTIDARIQQIAEAALDESLMGAQASVGFAAVMEVKTGKILAMAVRPSFNPNDFKRYPLDNYRNRMLADTFEPGSTFKSFTLAAVLDSGSAKADDELFCEDGAFELDGSIINDTSSHGWFTVEEIIVHSSNIGAAKLGLKLGRTKLGDYVRRFGFGAPTGIGLASENPGIVRPMKKISRVGVATVAFGQGIAVTGMQLLTAFNSIANNGTLLQPNIVEKIENAEGQVVFVPDIKSRRVLSEAAAKEETRILINVIHGGGTGGRAAPRRFTAAGKTGTAQKVNLEGGGYYEDRYVASFLGFAPASHPAITVLVVVDDPKGEPWGGTVAAPAFRTIVERTLPLLGVMPEGAGRPLNEVAAHVTPPAPTSDDVISTAVAELDAPAVQQPAVLSNCDGCMPNLVGMTLREIINAASKHGAALDISGSGRAVSQSPAAGTPVAGNGRWWVKLSTDPY